MKDFDKMQNIELNDEQQELIRLMREMAEDVPVPMALQPDMILSRLPDKPAKLGLLERLRIPKKAITGMAAVMAAFVAVLMTGKDPIKQYLNGEGPAVVTPETVVTSESELPEIEVSVPEIEVSIPVSEEASEPESLPIIDEPDEPIESSLPAEEPVEPVVVVPVEPSEPVEPALPPEQPAEDTVEIPAEDPYDVTVSTEPPVDTVVDDGIESILPSGEIRVFRATIVDPNAGATNLPSGEGADYADIYAALQQAVTPQNANQQYETAVLSAGLSADGLGQTAGQTLTATDGEYFYVSYQNSETISIIEGGKTNGKKIGTIHVTFETPVFNEMKVTDTAITDCYYSNGELFVVGTVSYSGSKGSKTISAVTCYDVNDPRDPKLLSATAQDGTMVGATMTGGYLYIFSRYYPDTTVQESYPAGYIPLLYGEGLATLPEAECITISEGGTDSYIVATSRSIKNPGDIIDCEIVQGCGKNFFLGKTGLYLFQENSYQMETILSGVSFLAGELTVADDVTVDGILTTLEAPNEFGQTLRLMTASYGETNDTHLYILDRNLTILGKAESLLEDSVLRSVRFDGNMLYYTVYGYDGQVYALNLLDPANLRSAEVAEPEEEALISVNTEGNYSVKLTGRKGRTELALTLWLTGLQRDTISIQTPNGYDEEHLDMTYMDDNYLLLTTRDGYNDVIRLYNVADDTITEVLTFECPVSENGKCYIQNGKFFVITSMRTISFNLEDGSQLHELFN